MCLRECVSFSSAYVLLAKTCRACLAYCRLGCCHACLSQPGAACRWHDKITTMVLPDNISLLLAICRCKLSLMPGMPCVICCLYTCHLIQTDAHTYRTGSDASHRSFSFTAKARPPDTDSQRGSTLSPRGSQGGIPLSPKIPQPTSSRELHTSAKPRPDSSFAVKVSHSYISPALLYSPRFLVRPHIGSDMSSCHLNPPYFVEQGMLSAVQTDLEDDALTEHHPRYSITVVEQNRSCMIIRKLPAYSHNLSLTTHFTVTKHMVASRFHCVCYPNVYPVCLYAGALHHGQVCGAEVCCQYSASSEGQCPNCPLGGCGRGLNQVT